MAFADDYVEVKDRIVAFYEKFPQGSLQSEITHLTDSLVVVKAWAYRTADDPRPSVGHSSLTIPGKTNFTRDAEIENAETSAWGRAIAALGFEVKKSIASKQEVNSKRAPAPERHTCPVHKIDMVQGNTGKWGHMVDGQPCFGEVAAVA